MGYIIEAKVRGVSQSGTCGGIGVRARVGVDI